MQIFSHSNNFASNRFMYLLYKNKNCSGKNKNKGNAKYSTKALELNRNKVL